MSAWSSGASPPRAPRRSAKENGACCPEVLSLRLVRCRLDLPGFRTRQIILVTTLLDSAQYPPAALGQLYYRRWAMELTLRNLKTTLQMEHLSCKTPANLEREIRMHLLAHNLVRRLMLESARTYRVPLERLSFAGALACARRYGEALLAARSHTPARSVTGGVVPGPGPRLGAGAARPARAAGRQTPPQTLPAPDVPSQQVPGDTAPEPILCQ